MATELNYLIVRMSKALCPAGEGSKQHLVWPSAFQDPLAFRNKLAVSARIATDVPPKYAFVLKALPGTTVPMAQDSQSRLSKLTDEFLVTDFSKSSNQSELLARLQLGNSLATDEQGHKYAKLMVELVGPGVLAWLKEIKTGSAVAEASSSAMPDQGEEQCQPPQSVPPAMMEHLRSVMKTIGFRVPQSSPDYDFHHRLSPVRGKVGQPIIYKQPEWLMLLWVRLAWDSRVYFKMPKWTTNHLPDPPPEFVRQMRTACAKFLNYKFHCPATAQDRAYYDALVARFGEAYMSTAKMPEGLEAYLLERCPDQAILEDILDHLAHATENAVPSTALQSSPALQ